MFKNNLTSKRNVAASDSEGEGYASRAYAESLSEFGELIHLPLSNGYLLKREIPGTQEFDAMGCYPLFFCEDWSRLDEDLSNLPDEIVSVSIVGDPFGAYWEEDLNACFDVVNPFKEHFIVDLKTPMEEIGIRHHRKEARKSFKKVRVEVCKDPEGFVDLWSELYGNLQIRHNIQGIRAFSRTAFRQQLGMPEMIVHQAFYENELVGAQLYFVQDDVVHCHLGAVTDQGYKHGAFYAMDSFSYDYFSERASRLDLGGGIGFSGSGEDGLSLYKKGWSAETHPVYFCGRITNADRYRALTADRRQEHTHYFPAYRAGEFS